MRFGLSALYGGGSLLTARSLETQRGHYFSVQLRGHALAHQELPLLLAELVHHFLSYPFGLLGHAEHFFMRNGLLHALLEGLLPHQLRIMPP